MSEQGESPDTEGPQPMDNDNDNGIQPEPAEMLEQIKELAKKQEAVMTAMSTLNTEPTRSYVYVPRERHISAFSGDIDKDGRCVDEFIEEIERALSARNQSAPERFDFVMSLLRGPALDEVRLRKADGDDVPDLFVYLREAFGDKRSASQLLQNFYNCKQKEGEDIRSFSHALSQALSAVLKQHPNSVADEKTVLRDQFVEGVRDSSLRRELKKYVRTNPSSTLIEVREEAYLWSTEDPAPGIKVVRPKVQTCNHVTAEAQCCAATAKDNSAYLEDVMKALKEQGRVNTLNQSSEKSVSFEDVLKVLAEQGKVITELTKAVQELTTQSKNTSSQKQMRTKTAFRFTPDGQPICFKCQATGHVAKQCPQRKLQNSAMSSDSHQQGNGNPWL
ncbi:hypothetical protein WMY93_033628, partial [Mugilogobius chulae]